MNRVTVFFIATTLLRASVAWGQRDIVSELGTASQSRRAPLIDELLRTARTSGTPFIRAVAGSSDSVAADFIYIGDSTKTRRVGLLGGPGTLDSTRNELRRTPGTNVWTVSVLVPRRARFLYAFGVDDASGTRQVVHDSLNATSAPLAPGVIRSVLEAPDAPVLSFSIPRASNPKGILSESTFTSRLLGQERHIWVYRPPGFSAGQSLPLAVIFDGAPYTNAQYVPTPTILDNLIAERRIRPIVAVFIDTPQPSRRVDLWLSDQFSDFVTDELIPWARTTYGLSTNPRETAAAGSSLGGLTALFVAMRRPQVVGRVISQSGSYWTGKLAGSDTAPEWMARALSRTPKLPIDVWMEVGSYESAATNAIGMAPTNRRLRDLLLQKGYAVSYSEFAGGHEYINWRASLPAALEHVFARTP